MALFEALVERLIVTAMAEGAFDHLPGRRRPLALDDDCLVPEDLRLVYRVLKNAGYVPEELVLRSEIAGIHVLLEKALDAPDRHQANKRLALLRTRLATRSGDRPVYLDGEYRDQIRRAFAVRP